MAHRGRRDDVHVGGTRVHLGRIVRVGDVVVCRGRRAVGARGRETRVYVGEVVTH